MLSRFYGIAFRLLLIFYHPHPSMSLRIYLARLRSIAQRERYYDIAAQCDKETMLQSHYSPDCMDKRNRYMVDHADFIIAVWDGRPSGTGKTVTYARGRNVKSIIVIDPVTLAVRRL